MTGLHLTPGFDMYASLLLLLPQFLLCICVKILRTIWLNPVEILVLEQPVLATGRGYVALSSVLGALMYWFDRRAIAWTIACTGGHLKSNKPCINNLKTPS